MSAAWALGEQTPRVDATAWVAPSATLVGGVRIGAQVGVYDGAVLRAEDATIHIGARSNLQDNVVVHAGLAWSVHVGTGVVVGHAAVVHGCTVEDDVLVGMGAILLNGCVIGTGSVVGAGALVTEGVHVPPGSLVLGSPGRVVRPTTDQERAGVREGAQHYVDLLDRHRRRVRMG